MWVHRWSLALQPQILRYQWEKEESEVQHSDHTPKTDVFVDNPTGKNTLWVILVETWFTRSWIWDFCRQGAISLARPHSGHRLLCKSTPGLYKDIRGGNSFWNLHLLRHVQEAECRFITNSPTASKNGSSAVEQIIVQFHIIPDSSVLPFLSLLEGGSSAEPELSCWHLPPQKSVSLCPDTRNNSVYIANAENILT